MAQGDNFKRENLPTMQQLQYLMELEKLGKRRGNVAMIADICGVHHGSVSRYLKICCENGLLTKEYTFTPNGKLWLDGYKKLIKDLEVYLHNIGMAESEIPGHTKRMIENLEYHVLVNMIRSDREMRRDHSTDKKENTSKNFLSEVLEYGNYPVGFMLFRVGHPEGTQVSMANRGFERPAVLRHNKRGSWLQLSIREMSAQSRMNGEAMTGHLESLKFEQDGMLHQAEIKNGVLRIPLDACRFRKRQGGEMSGSIPITVSCSVGRVHMPESTAVRMFWL